MRLFTQDSSNQFNYIGDYDITPSGNGGGAPQVPMDRTSPESRERRQFMRRYSKTILGVIIGLIVGILFLSIGFFETLLLAILMGIGFLVGGFFDRNPLVMKFLNNLG